MCVGKYDFFYFILLNFHGARTRTPIPIPGRPGSASGGNGRRRHRRRAGPPALQTAPRGAFPVSHAEQTRAGTPAPTYANPARSIRARSSPAIPFRPARTAHSSALSRAFPPSASRNTPIPHPPPPPPLRRRYDESAYMYTRVVCICTHTRRHRGV